MSIGIYRLSLHSFRSYKSLNLSIEGRHVVVTGPNGIGKTNLLEAISFFAPGRGLRKAKMLDVQKVGSIEPWAVKAFLWDGTDDSLELSTHLSTDQQSRKAMVSGAKLPSNLDLTHYITVNWATPELDRLFVEGGSSKRRKFLDHLISGLYPEHAKHLHTYDLAVKERNRLLKEKHLNLSWISSVEEIMAKESYQILTRRLEAFTEFQASQTYLNSAITDISGKALFTAGLEQMCIESEVNPSVEWILSLVQDARKQDIYSGTSSVGAHKMDFSIFNEKKGLLADMSSTGEQKILLLWLLLAFIHLQSESRQGNGILLLDEIPAHLDINRRAMVFEVLDSLAVQVWYSGTDQSLFSALKSKSTQYLAVESSQDFRVTY